MAGLGMLLNMAHADGAAQGDGALVVVHTSDGDFGYYTVIIMTVVTLVAMTVATMCTFCWRSSMNTKVFKDAASQCDSEELGVVLNESCTQYNCRDVVESENERYKMRGDYFRLFYAMTINSARQYLNSRGVHCGSTTKLNVTDTCVMTRMREVMSGRVADKYDGIMDYVRIDDRHGASRLPMCEDGGDIAQSSVDIDWRVAQHMQ